MNGTSPDVIVIGGGILGATTAWTLSTFGVGTLLLEAGSFARGGTGKSAAIVRCHYSNPEVVRMAVESRHILRTLPHRLECDPVYHRTGWLFLVDEEHAQGAVDNAAMQDEEGVDSIDVEDMAEYLPGIDPEGIAYAPLRARQRLRRPGRDHERLPRGGRDGSRNQLREGAKVDSIEVADGKVRGVRVNGELIACGTVVLAAGAWSVALGRTAGVEIPLEIVREQESILETSPQETISCAVSSQADRIYMRPAPEEGPAHLLIGSGFPKEYEVVEPDGYSDRVDRSFEEDVTRRLARRVPRFEEARPVAGKVGLFDVTPDWHPILGPVDEVEGLVLATGGSGHCFKLGPAIGEMTAAAVLGGNVKYADIGSFSLSRFGTEREFRSTYGGNRA